MALTVLYSKFYQIKIPDLLVKICIASADTQQTLITMRDDIQSSIFTLKSCTINEDIGAKVR